MWIFGEGDDGWESGGVLWGEGLALGGEVCEVWGR